MDDDEVHRMLGDVEATQQQTLGAASTDPEQIADLKDPVLFLLDLLCQIDTRAQLEVLAVLRRVFLPCLAFYYDERAFQDIPRVEPHTAAVCSPALTSMHAAAPSLAPHRRSANVVLKAFLNALHALSSKPETRTDVLEGVIALVKEMCVQSVSSADAVLLFDFLRVGKPSARQFVLELLTQLMAMETAPRAVFTMEGPHGGIVAPSSQMLFSKKGYTFSCGLQLNANSPVVSLYSFRGNSGQGISAVLDGATLVVKTHMQQGNFNQIVVPFADARRQMETTWTHLCIVHAKKIVFKDKLSVYVDAQLVHTGNLVYPDPLCMVGGHNCIGMTPAFPGLQGRLWSPTLFGSALAEAEIERLHWLTHWKSDLSSAAAENTGLTDKSKFIFSYDARSCDAVNRICYDVSGNDCHGWIEPGTNAFVTRCLAQALDSIGGCACFLLLLLDQIPEMADFHPTHEFVMDEIAQVFAFVAAGLTSSLACRAHFVRLRGVHVLAFVLQSISPSYLSLKLLDGVTAILDALMDAVPQRVAVEYIHLLLFLNTTWYLSPFETQSKLLADVLPQYLRIVQEKSASERQLASGSGGSGGGGSGGSGHHNSHAVAAMALSPASASRTASSSALIELENEPEHEVNVRFFCNLLVQVYSPRAREASSVEPMSDAQLEFLRKLIIHNLIHRLLFPAVPDASLNAWRQLVMHIQQRSGGIASTDDVNDSIELKELVWYLTQIMAADDHGPLSSSALVSSMSSSQTISLRQLMTNKICKLSEGTLRLWWRPMMAANANVRLEALKLFEVYTLDKILLRRRDVLMLHASLQAHPVTLATADVLLDIVIGRRRLGYLAGAASSGSPSASAFAESGGSRVVNIARQDFVPTILLGLLQHADFEVQAHVLLEISAQLAVPMSGKSLKEAIRAWPPWLGRLRALAVQAADHAATHVDETQVAECDLEPWLREKLALLTDKRSPVSSRLEAVHELSNTTDSHVAQCALHVFERSEQPLAVIRAIAALIRKRLPHRCDVIVRRLATHMIADIAVYSVLHVRSGWMHVLELYFFHFRAPADLCAMSALVCARLLAKLRAKELPSLSDVNIRWENVAQVAAILTQCGLVAQQPMFTQRAALTPRQQQALMHQALELWLVVLPYMRMINWSDMRDHLAAHANYGADVTVDEKAVFCNLVASGARARFLALHCGLELVRLTQQTGECTANTVRGLQQILRGFHVIPQAATSNENHTDSATNPAVKTITRRTRSSSGSYASTLSASSAKTAAELKIADSSSFFEFARAAPSSTTDEVRALVHLHVLETCFALLQCELARPESFAASFAIVEVMVAVASSALVLLPSDAAAPELAKTLQIISSTDLTFFHESSQLEDFFTLWQLHREIHATCCDAARVHELSEALHAPFLWRWSEHVAQSPSEFNPYLTHKHAASQAEMLSGEMQSCERLWQQIADDSASAMRGADCDSGDDSRLSALKEVVERFASSVHKLIAHSGAAPSLCSDTADSDRVASGECRRVHDGLLLKVDSKENSLRMHLRLKTVRDNYRLRTLSCELAGSASFQDTESRASGRLARQLLRGSRDGTPYASEQEPSWRSDAGSDYSDFLADAQMRAAIIRSCSNVDIRNSEYEVPSDEDDLDDDDDDNELQFGAAGDDDESDNASEEVKDVLQFYSSSTDADADAAVRESLARDDASSALASSVSNSPNTGRAQYAKAPVVASTKESTPSSPVVSAVGSAPSSTSSLSAFSIGASMLSVVGGVAGLVQKAAREAKDAVEFGVDSLYTAKDALTDEAQSLIDEVSTYMEENGLESSAAAPGSSAARGSGSPNSRSSPTAIAVHQSRASDRLVMSTHTPAPAAAAGLELQPKPKEHDAASSAKSKPLARSTSSKQDVVVGAKLVRHMHVVDGVLVVTDTTLYFIPERVIDEHDTVLVEKTPGCAVAEMWRFLFKRRKWRLDDIVSLNRRRYLLKPTALELFVLSTRRNYFFNLSHNDLALLHETLMARRPLLLKRDPAMRRLRHPSSIFRTSTMTARWTNHEVSTFEYLMWLNTIAGRTYNDLTQYPIFPWVISDYDSHTLDLARAKTFRDLTKPVGALEPTRLKFFLERYNAFEDSDIPKFMYGTHYSNIGAVLYYLIRLEPYTSYAMSVQGGKFDHADRLFHSVAETWHNCLHDFTDVKELTPEWFYLPDFLVNCNGLELGTKQNGVDLGDVVLPPWARSPEDFVLQNLVALESEYVSAHIHHWIDLVFGAKQRGPAAVAAHNVFFYLTYEGMVDIDSIADPVTKSSMRAQIAHFGQTPSQVLRELHPVRSLRGGKPPGESLSGAVATLLAQHELEHAVAASTAASSGSPHAPPVGATLPALLALPHDHAIVFMQMVYGTSMLLCVDSNGMVSTQRFGGKLAKVHHHSPFLSDLSASATKASGVFKSQGSTTSPPHGALSGAGTPVGSPPSSGNGAGFMDTLPSAVEYIELHDRKCRRLTSEKQMMQRASQGSLSHAMVFINGGTVFCTVGHHDFSARFYSASDGTLLYRLLQHNAVVTCLATSRTSSTLALGSADGTVSVWKVANINPTLLDTLKLFRGAKSNKPVHANDYAADQVLLGHSAAINCVAVSDELGVCVSGSAANECLAHNLDDGSILRQFPVPGQLAPGVVSVLLSPVGHVLVQSMGTGVAVLYAFHFNGALMATAALGDQPMRSLAICARYSKVVLSNSERAVALSAHTLANEELLLERTTVGGAIVSQALSPDETHLVFGVASGRIVSLPLLP